MRLTYFVLAMAILLITISWPLEGKRMVMLPLTAKEVYRILRDAGQEDAVPEGRVVSQGIAAVTGFTLGLAKGIGGAVALGAAALGGATALAGGGGSSCCNQQAQEVCFQTRSLNDIYDGEDEEIEDYDQPQGRQQTSPSPTYTDYTDVTPTTTSSIASPGTTTSDPLTDGTGTNGGTDTSTDTGDGTGTITDTTTSTGNEGSVNCVVVQQPSCSCSGGGQGVKIG